MQQKDAITQVGQACFDENLCSTLFRPQCGSRDAKMPRKVKRREEVQEWERQADKKFEGEEGRKATRERPEETPHAESLENLERRKKEKKGKGDKEVRDTIPVSTESDLGLLNVGDGVLQDACKGYTHGFGDSVALDDPGEGERSRSELASAAFGHDSVRGAYEELGAAGFYESKGASYMNPHEDVLSEARGFMRQKVLLPFFWGVCFLFCRLHV